MQKIGMGIRFCRGSFVWEEREDGNADAPRGQEVATHHHHSFRIAFTSTSPK